LKITYEEKAKKKQNQNQKGKEKPSKIFYKDKKKPPLRDIIYTTKSKKYK
jgi:hypothetical protein